MQQYNSGDLIAFCDAEDVELIEYIKNNNLNGRKLQVMGESDFPATIKIQVRCLLKSIQDAQQPQSISSSPFTHWFREAIHPLQQQQAQQQQQLEHHYRQQHFEQTQKDQSQFTDLTSTTASSATASLYSNNQAAFIDTRSTNNISVVQPNLSSPSVMQSNISTQNYAQPNFSTQSISSAQPNLASPICAPPNLSTPSIAQSNLLTPSNNGLGEDKENEENMGETTNSGKIPHSKKRVTSRLPYPFEFPVNNLSDILIKKLKNQSLLKPSDYSEIVNVICESIKSFLG